MLDVVGLKGVGVGVGVGVWWSFVVLRGRGVEKLEVGKDTDILRLLNEMAKQNIA